MRRHDIDDAFAVGESKLVLMSSTFDVISEAPLHTDEFGEGTIVVASHIFLS